MLINVTYLESYLARGDPSASGAAPMISLCMLGQVKRADSKNGDGMVK